MILRTLSSEFEMPKMSLAQFANKIGESVDCLKYLSNDSVVTYASARKLKKRNNGYRIIHAPNNDLKGVHIKILENFLNDVIVHESCCGFVAGRSILTNVMPHVGQKKILKLDLKDFFSTISSGRINNCATNILNLDSETALIFTKLVSHAKMLPQGAPTSPCLANIIAKNMDARLYGLAKKFNLNYTRYADDITFSGDRISFLIYKFIIEIIKSEGFEIADGKTKFMSSKNRQMVTGLVVNTSPSVLRKERRKLRGIIHNCRLWGVASQRRAIPNFQQHLRGRIEFIRITNPAAAKKLYEEYLLLDWSLIAPISTEQDQVNLVLELLQKLCSLNSLVSHDHHQNLNFNHINSLLCKCETSDELNAHCVVLELLFREKLRSFYREYLIRKLPSPERSRGDFDIIEEFMGLRIINYKSWNLPFNDVRLIGNIFRHPHLVGRDKILKRYCTESPDINYSEVWNSLLKKLISNLQILLVQCSSYS